MNDESAVEHGQLALHGAGDKLRMAREARGMTIEQVAADTRIPRRHLELLEKGDYAGLPARTYATGFARTYAKAVGADDKEIVADVRAELAGIDGSNRSRPATFEPGDPAHVPSRGLALASIAALLLLLVGGVMFYNAYLAPGSGPPSLLDEEKAAAAAAPKAVPTAAVPASGPVVFTALEPNVWVKFYDAAGTQLMQKEMAQGETYTVPADANGPQVWTGRPDALAITVGGRPVAKIAEEQRIVRDVPVTAAALLARAQAPAATPNASATAASAAISAAPRTQPSRAARSAAAPAVRRAPAAAPTRAEPDNAPVDLLAQTSGAATASEPPQE